MRISGLIPNGLSMLNLIFGFLSIISSIEKDFTNAALFIFLAITADAFDGKIARRVNAVSDMGKEFDSLADLVSFGVASAVLTYMYALSQMKYGIFIPVFMVACTALRLARFNVDPNSDHFLGTPSPAFGFFAAAYIVSGISLETRYTAIIFVIASFAMISTFKYPTFKHTSRKAWAALGLICLGMLALLFLDIKFIFTPYLLYLFAGPFVYRWMVGRKSLSII